MLSGTFFFFSKKERNAKMWGRPAKLTNGDKDETARGRRGKKTSKIKLG